MKKITIVFTSPTFTYYLPDGMNGEEFKLFKRDYFFILDDLIEEALFLNKTEITINMDQLPILADDLDALKSFMTDSNTVQLWNQKREEAKSFFTAPCISELDASGYIKKLLK